MNKHCERNLPRPYARSWYWSGRPWSRTRTLAAAAAGASVLIVACSASSAKADTFLGGTYHQALAYTKCMRSHGVTDFPAPDSQGNFNRGAIQAIYQRDNPALPDAHHLCAPLLPNGGSGLSATQIQTIQEQNLRDAVKAARCMRAYGIENFPDPAGTTQGPGVNWPTPQAAGLNVNSFTYQAAYRACRAGGVIPPTLAPTG
jgi:hypothetical protein